MRDFVTMETACNNFKNLVFELKILNFNKQI